MLNYSCVGMNELLTAKLLGNNGKRISNLLKGN